MQIVLQSGVAVLAITLLARPSFAQPWQDDLESYAAGSQLVGQGGWEEWGPGAGALVSMAHARSGLNSIDVRGATDLVRRYAGAFSGKWKFTAWQFVPTGITAKSYFILLNTYDAATSTYDWSVQMGADPATGHLDVDAGGGNVIGIPLVTDAWVPIEVVIHLDADWVQIYYGGILVDDPALADHPTLGGGQAWTAGVFGGGSGARNIGALDLYANGASSVYYDDLSLVPYDGLMTDREAIDTKVGGTVAFALNATTENAHRTYVVLGSFSGTTPGFPLPGGLTLPINWDSATQVILENLTLDPPFHAFFGTLDARGEASAALVVPAYPVPGDITMHFAYTLLEIPWFSYASNAAPVVLLE